ncbi:hypothetical protein L2H87_001986 [Salmonella enterica]|nr:hypothetical protein [Salmonella enterica]
MCPTAISMNAYVLRIHILPYVVELSGELGFPRNPDTGLALGQTCQSGIWVGGAKINSNACMWVSSPDAWVNPGPRQFYKTAYCPTGYIQTGSRFMLWPKGLDDEHVDVYCCPLS